MGKMRGYQTGGGFRPAGIKGEGNGKGKQEGVQICKDGMYKGSKTVMPVISKASK